MRSTKSIMLSTKILPDCAEVGDVHGWWVSWRTGCCRFRMTRLRWRRGDVTLEGEVKGPSVTSWRSFANIYFLSETVKGLIIPLIDISGCHRRQRKAAQTSFTSFWSTTSCCSWEFYHPLKADEALWTSDRAERPQTNFSLYLVVCWNSLTNLTTAPLIFLTTNMVPAANIQQDQTINVNPLNKHDKAQKNIFSIHLHYFKVSAEKT